MKRAILAGCVLPLVLLAVMMTMSALASAASAGAGQVQISADMQALLQRQQQSQENLVWFIQGLRDMDKNKSLRLTSAQAKQLLVIYEKWIKEETIRLKTPTPPANAARGSAQPREQRQFNTADQTKMTAELKTRQTALEADMAKAEKALTSAQVRFLDNMNFDPAIYGLGGANMWQNGGGFGAGGSGSGFSGGAPSGQASNSSQMQATMERMQKERQQEQERLIKLYNEVYTLLKQRAK